MMDACIEVSSELGKGSTFTVTITVDTAQPDIHEMQNAPSVVMPMGPLKDIFNGKRVLLAEDIEINREIIHSLLEDTGLEIVYAQDGAEALDLFCAAPQSYDLILMDVQMPNMDGDEATKKIRSSGHPGAESIPVIALTANVFREDIERYLSAGMNGHLGKPIDPRQLTEMLAQYLIGK